MMQFLANEDHKLVQICQTSFCFKCLQTSLLIKINQWRRLPIVHVQPTQTVYPVIRKIQHPAHLCFTVSGRSSKR
ncbi:hypothetical protein PsorP6_007102 [Peronosclerospora sorghi]|uniref:Uncharacterized protein n=1 Tax=Peronosclerospora sorghi TaxID=230839 RepID=A0ACC0W9M8_9STRA|nr:hypothetical protein PsorP6_007102 [Peronosclerospora sorghi]